MPLSGKLPFHQETPILDPGVVKVQIVTVSLEDMGCHARADFGYRLQRSMTKMQDEMFPDLPIHAFVDARDFHDMHGPKGHSGLHQRSVYLFIKQAADFKVFIKNVLSLLQGFADVWDPLEVFRIGVVCKAGINRSVSGAHIIDHCMSRSGYSMEPIEFLSQGKWINRGICPGTCWECDDRKICKQKRGSLEKAYDVWVEEEDKMLAAML